MLKRSVSLFFIAILSFSAFFGAVSMPTSSANKERGFVVAIDAGHGGIDGGATGGVSGVSESEINLSIAKKLRAVFERGGFSVVMTRTSEAGLYGLASDGFKRRDMAARVKTVNDSKADILISVHLNTFSDHTRRGAQVFFRAGDSKGEELAACVQKSLNEMEECVKKASALTGDYYILNETFIPSIICEYGFLSNPEDERLLLTDEYQKSLALSTFQGVLLFFAGGA